MKKVTVVDERLRFFAFVEDGPIEQHMSTPCWLWMSNTNALGYGRFSVVRDGTRRMIAAHRWAYERFVGPIPDGLVLDHLCLVKNCVNPNHLEAVTQPENARRAPRNATTVNLRKTHCPEGHPFSGPNLYVSPRGWRYCRKCMDAHGKKWKKKVANA